MTVTVAWFGATWEAWI